MAVYKTCIEAKTGITLVEVTGPVALEELMSFMNSREFGERTSRVVADLRHASLEGVSRGALAKMVRAVKHVNKPGIQGAYVFRKGDDLSKGKLMLAQLEVLGYEGKFRIFTDIEKAVSWVLK